MPLLPPAFLRRWFTLPPWLVVLLALVAALNLLKIGFQPLTPDRPIDFRPQYVGQWLLGQHQQPYDDAALRRAWHQIATTERFATRTEPGLPDTPLTYPPWALGLYRLLLGALPYQAAWPFWYALCLLSLALSCRLWPGIIRRWGGPRVTVADLLLLALALKGTVSSLLTGQPSYVGLLLGTAALATAQRGRPWLTGTLLGLLAFKPTLALPFGLLALASFQPTDWLKLAAAGAAVNAALLAVVAAHFPDLPALFRAWAAMVSVVRTGVFDPTNPDYPLGYAMVSLTELGTVLEYGWRGAHRWQMAGYAALVAGVAFWAGRQRPNLAPLTAWGVAALVTLLVTNHLFYDALLLLPLAAWARTVPPRWAAGLLLAASPLFMPINGVLDALHRPAALQWAYFTLPLSILATLAVVLWAPTAPSTAAHVSRT